MHTNNIDQIPFYFFDSLGQFPDLIHFITTRSGGISKGTFASLNLSLRVNDDAEAVSENRRRIAKTFLVPEERMVFSSQTHGVKVEVIDDKYLQYSDLEKSQKLFGVDGMVTALPQVCLCILTADCASVVLYDPLKKAIGIAHAGWKGTIGKIAAEVYRQMHLNYNSQAEDLFAAIGPCISLDSFEVGEEVASVFRNTFPFSEDIVINKPYWEKPHVDIVRANFTVLTECGIRPERIETSGICTYQQPDIFFSARRNAGGRFGCGVMLQLKLE